MTVDASGSLPRFLVNGEQKQTAIGGGSPNGLYTNAGSCCGGETSDFQVSEILIWNRALTKEEMAVVDKYL